MNNIILNTGVQKFIEKNRGTDIVSVLLKKPIFDGISNQELVEQLEAKKKCEKKLPIWFKSPKIYYPNKLNIEQTSSEIAAQYKAGIVSGKSLLDVTGGFGVDSYFFSKKIGQVYHCEIDKKLSQIVAHNLAVLEVDTIKTIATDGLKFLEKSKSGFDWIYLDPSRRNDRKGKVFRLSDCSPNVTAHLDLLFEKSENILLKTSPLLDLSMGIKELEYVKEIHIIASNNEVKELLWVLQKGYQGHVDVKTINFTGNNNQIFDFSFEEEKNAQPTYSHPLSYIYEPNTAILKSGAFKLLANRFHLKKLHEHTHLYTSNDLVGFPGKIFKIDSILPYNKKTIRRLGIAKANVKIRNFPEKVEEIRKKHKIGDGGEVYLFFTKQYNGVLLVLACTKVKGS